MTNNYENYGCEYLQLETEPQKPLERFKTLPMVLVAEMVDSALEAKIWASEATYVHGLADSIRQTGLKEPGVITIAPNGVTLSDGNHRYLAYKLLQKSEYPVIITNADKPIKQGGISLQKFNQILLEEIYGV